MQPIGVSEYHGGAVDLNRASAKGLLFRANYTWAKAMDNGTNDLFTSVVNPRRPQNPNNLRRRVVPLHAGYPAQGGPDVDL